MRPIIGLNDDCLWLCGDVCGVPLPPISICPQEPWKAQEEAHRDRIRVKNFRFVFRHQGPSATSACAHLGLYGSAQGVRKWEGWRSRRAATRATAAQRPERTNKAFDFVAWKGGVACSEAVQTMGAWLARCGRVPVQRVARSHATVSVSPIREELGR